MIGQYGDGERKIGILLSVYSRNALRACESRLSDRFEIVLYDAGQVPMGILPTGQPPSMHALKYSQRSGYERTLQGIPKQKFQHARRLFQCIVTAIRPLRVEELAEIFAIEFGPNEVTNLVEGWRPENTEEAVLSACSSLIAIIDDQGSNFHIFR